MKPEISLPMTSFVAVSMPALSISGSQRGFEDARGTLLYQILRIVEHSQPKVILLENVRNYLTHKRAGLWRRP